MTPRHSSGLCKGDLDEVIVLIQKHLVSLSQELDKYFPDITDLDCQLIRNPLKMDPRSLPDELQDQFIDYVSDLVRQIRGAFVQMVIQAPNLAWISLRGYIMRKNC